MTPISFKHSNTVYAKDQPEYLPLPAHKSVDGIVTSCCKLSFKERLRVLFIGRLFISNMTFNLPLQPQLPSTTFKP